jgi:hypothetical protein
MKDQVILILTIVTTGLLIKGGAVVALQLVR